MCDSTAVSSYCFLLRSPVLLKNGIIDPDVILAVDPPLVLLPLFPLCVTGPLAAPTAEISFSYACNTDSLFLNSCAIA